MPENKVPAMMSETLSSLAPVARNARPNAVAPAAHAVATPSLLSVVGLSTGPSAAAIFGASIKAITTTDTRIAIESNRRRANPGSRSIAHMRITTTDFRGSEASRQRHSGGRAGRRRHGGRHDHPHPLLRALVRPTRRAMGVVQVVGGG